MNFTVNLGLFYDPIYYPPHYHNVRGPESTHSRRPTATSGLGTPDIVRMDKYLQLKFFVNKNSFLGDWSK